MPWKKLCVFALTILSLGSNLSWAEYAIRRTRNGSIILSGDNCAGLQIQVHSLRQWALNIGEHPRMINPQCLQLSPLHFEADITAVVPSFIVQYQGVNPRHNGPNCFNAAMYLSGQVSHLRYMDEQEIEARLASPSCIPIPSTQELRPGDIGQIRGTPDANQEGQTAEVHSFVYISDNLVFSKDGITRTHPFTLQPMSFILGSRGYHMNSVPQRCRMVGAVTPNGCSRWINYFRCTSTYPPRAPRAPSCFRYISNQVDRTEAFLSRVAMSQSSTGLDLDSVQNALAALQRVVTKEIEAMQTPHGSLSCVQLDLRNQWHLLLTRIISLQGQIDDI